MPSIVFEYGLLPPTEGRDEVMSQLSKAQKYYNKLVEIENAARAKKLDVVLTVQDKEEKKLAYAAIDAEALVLSKAARAECEVYFGTYLLVEAAAAQAAKATPLRVKKKKKVKAKKTKKGKKKQSPLLESGDEAIEAEERSPVDEPLPEDDPKEASTIRYRRWTGEGMVGSQIHVSRPLTNETIFNSTDTRVRIDPIDPGAFDKELPRGARRRLQYTTFRMRVGGGKGTPHIWASWPLYLHREIPEGARLTWAKVILRRICGRERWVLQLTFKVPEKVVPLSNAKIALNLGWRKVGPDTFRVARWVDSDGSDGEFLVPPAVITRMEKANSIRSIRDKDLDVLKAWLCARKNELPEEVRGVIHLWRAPSRFIKLGKSEELSPEIAAKIEVWRKRDLHLWQYETGMRTGALNHRRELYRLFALDIARKYSYVVVEEYNMTDIVEDPDRLKHPSRQRFESATSTLRQVLRSTVSREGKVIIDADSVDATKSCCLCGFVGEWDAKKSIDHTCENCGETWDQDWNNAMNLFARSDGMIEDGLEKMRLKANRPARFAARHKKAA